MPNLEDLISRMALKISEARKGELFSTKVEFDYAYGQLKMDKKSKLYVYSHLLGRVYSLLPFLEWILRTGGFPAIFQERIDSPLDNKHLEWLDYVTFVPKRNMEKSRVLKTLTKLFKNWLIKRKATVSFIIE